MAVVDLSGCLVIVVRPEETRPLVVEVFASDLDRARLADWLGAQPELLEFVARALRLAGGHDDALDELSAVAGSAPGDDTAWLELLSRWVELTPAERRHLLRDEDDD